ncbi:hypothetical protein O6H91_05G015600 [Diphasiastrum complanatum]|nr:hypothetical protein O6H91_05G015600 [Diphasiastrum complanatum]KAJ7554928.1 hypothetical protein O6H91_05G015600 [Diphasiastrum complanatum]
MYSKETSTRLSGKRVIVVMDGSPAARQALMWALKHVVEKLDTLTLLNVLPKSLSSRSYPELELEDELPEVLKQHYETASKLALLMKDLCSECMPEVQVETLIVAGDKGPTIVAQASKLEASILVLGHKKPGKIWRMLGWKTDGHVKYCIQNCKCLTLAVRKKSRGVGGYLINSKRLKNFWLLA